MIRTITTAAGVNTVRFNDFYRYFWVKNNGSTEVYVSARSTISPNAEFTAKVNAGDCVRVDNYDDDNVYILGAGAVEIHAQDFPDCPFKVSAKGGGTVENAQTANTVEYPVIGLNIYGASTQEGTPTPDAPVEIVSVGDDGAVDVTACGKNLINIDRTYEMSTAGYVFNNRPTNLIAGETYTFSFNCSVYIDGASAAFEYMCVDDSKELIVFQSVKEGLNNITFICAKQVKSVRFYVNISTTAVFSNIQLERGNIVTDYEPYKGDTATITSGLPLYGIDDVCDELIYNADGTGKIVKRFGRVIVTAANITGMTPHAGFGNYFSTNIVGTVVDDSSDAKPKCNRFVGVKFADRAIPDTINMFRCFLSQDGRIILRNSAADNRFTTVAEVQDFVTANETIIVYPLAAATEIELTAAEMAALQQLQTFDGTTTVSNDENAEMIVKCCTNPMLSEYVYPLIKRLTDENAELKAAVLSLGGNV